MVLHSLQFYMINVMNVLVVIAIYDGIFYVGHWLSSEILDFQ